MAYEKTSSILNGRPQTFSSKSADGHWATIRFLVNRNMVQLEAATNNPADRNKQRNFGKITCNISFVDFMFILDQFDKMIKSEKEASVAMQLSDTVWKDGQRTKDPEPVCRLTIGKNEKLIVYIEVEDLTNVGLGTLRYYPGTPDRRTFAVLSPTGEVVPPAKVINAYARSWYTAWSTLVPAVMVQEWQPPSPPGSNGGGGGGGGNSGGAPKRAPANVSDGDLGLDDDIPF